MAETDERRRTRANATLVLETLFGVAAHPERWEQIIDALGGEAPAAPVRRDNGPGVVLFGARGGLAGWNAAGEAFFLQRLGAIEAGGLTFFNPDNHEALDMARRRLRDARGRQIIVKFVEAADETPRFAYVTAAADLPPALRADVASAPSGGEAVLAVVFPAVDPGDRLWSSLRTSFGLTPAETRLAARLRDGLTLKEAAEELGVSLNTVRNQLRAVFDKIGLSRQSDLVSALTRLGALTSDLQGARRLAPLGPPIRADEGGVLAGAPPLQTFVLPDGRRLAYRAYGDPRGRGAMVIHQGLGCSLLPRGSDALARDLGLRIICPERPGVGGSDPHPRYGFDAVAGDFAALHAALGLGEVRLAGFMSGAAFAAALAARLGPQVKRFLLVSVRPPGRKPETAVDARHRMVLFRRRILQNPWLTDVLFAVMRMNLSPRQVERFVRTAASAPSDAAYLDAHPAVLAFLVDSISQSLANTSRGIADEVKCMARGAEPDLAGLSAPVTLWHGVDDPMTTVDDASAWLGGREAERRVFEGSGHFMAHQRWPEILAWLAAD